jgi:serine/threonine protein kinase
MTEVHRKTHPSVRTAQHERTVLRLAAGDGVVPLDDSPTVRCRDEVVTAGGRGSLADVLSEVGPIPEAAARGTGARIALTLARLHANGLVHGDIKPANVVFAPHGDLWLVDFDAADADGGARRRGTTERLHHLCGRTLRSADDVLALAIMVVECATGAILDLSTSWSDHDLERVGCSQELADDVGAILRTAPAAGEAARLLRRRDTRLPRPPRWRGSIDPTPTVDIPCTAIAGLAPFGDAANDAPPGWPHSAGPTPA